jgi:hypothetical protein
MFLGFYVPDKLDDLPKPDTRAAAQARTIGCIVVLAVGCRQLVAMRWQVWVPKIDRKPLFDHQEITVVDGTYRTPCLLLVLVLE